MTMTLRYPSLSERLLLGQTLKRCTIRYEWLFVCQVIDVDLGSMVPGISNLHALPCPTEALWPQTVFDLDYGGMLLLPASKCQTWECMLTPDVQWSMS